jgi:predicted alpha/beta-fold hydrolase
MPGVTGHSRDNYVMDLVKTANARGYSVIVLNHVGNENENTDQNLFLMEVGRGLKPITEQLVNSITNHLGSDTELYAVGFSLGGNYVLRGFAECDRDVAQNVKGLAVVSPAFDVLSTGVRLKHSYWGMLDKFVVSNLQRSWNQQSFAV